MADAADDDHPHGWRRVDQSESIPTPTPALAEVAKEVQAKLRRVVESL